MTEATATTAVTGARARRAQERVAWVAGTRGELLLLGPLLKRFNQRGVDAPIHFLFDTGEHGMAMQQAMDWLGMRADETAPLLHPADEASVRLQQVLERVEAFARQRKATRLVFTGFNATATACALLCHTRGNRGLWLRPTDPAGVVDGLRLESGYRRIIEACAPEVAVAELGRRGDALEFVEEEISGARRDAGVVLIAVLRREWGAAPNITGSLVQRVAAWARARPEMDWIFLSNLNARLERPFASVRERPANMLMAPPLPYPAYRALLARGRGMLTDSPLFAAEAVEAGLPLVVLGDQVVREGGDCARIEALKVGEAGVEWLERGPQIDTAGVERPGANSEKTLEAIRNFLSP